MQNYNLFLMRIFGYLKKITNNFKFHIKTQCFYSFPQINKDTHVNTFQNIYYTKGTIEQ